MTGMNRQTGALITGWPHVVQCLGDIFTTRFNERVIRRYVGSLVPHLLGKNETRSDILAFYTALITTIEMWEPRFAIKRVLLTGTGDALEGRLGFAMYGAYRPNALNGDFTEASAQTVIVGGQSGTTTSTGSGTVDFSDPDNSGLIAALGL